MRIRGFGEIVCFDLISCDLNSLRGFHCQTWHCCQCQLHGVIKSLVKPGQHLPEKEPFFWAQMLTIEGLNEVPAFNHLTALNCPAMRDPYYSPGGGGRLIWSAVEKKKKKPFCSRLQGWCLSLATTTPTPSPHPNPPQKSKISFGPLPVPVLLLSLPLTQQTFGHKSRNMSIFLSGFFFFFLIYLIIL